MTPKQIDSLKAKMYQVQKNLDDLEEEKKALVAGFNEQIKGAKNIIKSIISCIENDDLSYLSNKISEDELKKILKS